MKVSMVALCAFSGPDGTFAKGDALEVSATRAAFLSEGGFAQPVERFDPPASAKEVPAELRAAPEETLEPTDAVREPKAKK